MYTKGQTFAHEIDAANKLALDPIFDSFRNGDTRPIRGSDFFGGEHYATVRVKSIERIALGHVAHSGWSNEKYIVHNVRYLVTFEVVEVQS